MKTANQFIMSAVLVSSLLINGKQKLITGAASI